MEDKKSNPYMTLYEYAALINARALQLCSPGSRPMIKLEDDEEYDVIYIATKEVERKLVKLSVIRNFPDGSSEAWDIKDMVLPFERSLNVTQKAPTIKETEKKEKDKTEKKKGPSKVKGSKG